MNDQAAAPDGIVRRSIDQLPSLIGYWNAQLRNVFANRVYSTYFGFDPDRLVGMHMHDVLGADLFALNEPFVTGVLAGVQQQFDRTLVDVENIARHTQTTYVPDVVDGVVLGFTVLVVDVSERVEAERQRDQAVRLFEVAMENAPIGKAVLSMDGRWLQFNRALCELTGYSREELQNKTFRDITHPDDVPLADAHLAGLLDGSIRHVESEKRYVRKDGATIWVQRNATVVRDHEAGDVIIAQIQDITARKTTEETLARQVMIDDLTGLGNRRRLMSDLSSPLVRGDEPLGFLYLDVDEFKSVNDRHGHAVGDRVLIEIARRLVANTRDGDLACRIGGDEFVLVVRSAHSLDDIQRLADRIRTCVCADHDIDGVRVRIAMSVGVSWNPGGVDAEGLLRDADADMYVSKRR